MSQNVKYTEYTVISDTDIPNMKRVAVYKDFEKEIMMDYLKSEFDRCAYCCYGPIIITRETTIKNLHDGFKKQPQTRLRKIAVWDKYNRGLYGFLNYPCKSKNR